LYKATPCLIPAIAASASVIGSISRAYQFVDDYAHKARAEQHRANHDIKQILYARHATVSINKGFFNGRVAFSANSFVYGQLGGSLFSHS